MSALEALIAAGGEQELPDLTSYGLNPSSTAVTNRKQCCRACPTSASALTPTGTKTCRIKLGGQEFVDPNTIHVVYTLQNTGTAALCPTVGPWGPFGLVRLLSGGVELDNQDRYHRFHELHSWRLFSRRSNRRRRQFVVGILRGTEPHIQLQARLQPVRALLYPLSPNFHCSLQARHSPYDMFAAMLNFRCVVMRVTG